MAEYDKKEVLDKLDEHVKHILEKPSISNEDYAVLREKLSEMPTQSGFGDTLWPFLIAMMFASFGGKRNEL